MDFVIPEQIRAYLVERGPVRYRDPIPGQAETFTRIRPVERLTLGPPDASG